MRHGLRRAGELARGYDLAGVDLGRVPSRGPAYRTGPALAGRGCAAQLGVGSMTHPANDIALMTTVGASPTT
jgi:hypothetical protein